MRYFDYFLPNVNFFGPKSVEVIGDRVELLGIKKALIVTDGFLRNMENGPVKQVEKHLNDKNIEYVFYDGVEPNPKISNCLD